MSEEHKQSYITTYSGLYFDPLHPDMEQFRIEDAAHALSLICRGNGQVKTFCSVGQHCINCALEARARGLSGRVQLACLLHDTSEAYMSDVPRPFKQYLKDYIESEERLLALIYGKYLGDGITKEEARQVKQIDNDLLAYDLYYLLGQGSKDALPKLERTFDYKVRPFEEVEKEYLELFEELK